jgi:hypothetical protein
LIVLMVVSVLSDPLLPKTQLCWICLDRVPI